MRTKRAVILLVLVALAGALVAAQGQGCELMDGGGHALMACPAAILPAPLVLGLIALALVTSPEVLFRRQVVLLPADHPPRGSRAR